MYTLIEFIANIIKSDKLCSNKNSCVWKGKNPHTTIANTKVNIGDNIKIKILTWLGIIDSFKNNLTPSAIGCNKPYSPTIDGPFLICE